LTSPPFGKKKKYKITIKAQIQELQWRQEHQAQLNQEEASYTEEETTGLLEGKLKWEQLKKDLQVQLEI
jgi:hypothetical protein